MGKNDVRDIFEPLRKKFNEFDKTNEGTITKDEFMQAIKESGIDTKTAKIDDLFESFDVAKTGDITISEFITTLGAPLIRNPDLTVDDVFQETAKILLKQLGEGKIEKQWTDICGRHNIDPNRGTLTYEKFKELLEKECDWKMTQWQIIPIFHYLDLNQNGKISMITIRFMVTEMAKLRGKGRTIMVIDLLKQAMSAAQAEMIVQQSYSINRVKERLAKIRATISNYQALDIDEETDKKELTVGDVQVMRPSMIGRQFPEYLKHKKTKGSIGTRFITWPLLAVIVWFGVMVIYIISIFTARPIGDMAVDIDGLIISGIITSAGGAIHGFIVWPFRSVNYRFAVWMVGTAFLFAILAMIYFVLGITFFNPFWYKDNECFACKKCGLADDTICWDDWKLLGDWQDTCPCALKDEELWENANFVIFADLPDCNSTLYASNVFNYKGDSSVLEPCLYYQGGLFMNLGWAMIVFTLIAMINGCWGFLKNLKVWMKERMEYRMSTVVCTGQEKGGSQVDNSSESVINQGNRTSEVESRASRVVML